MFVKAYLSTELELSIVFVSSFYPQIIYRAEDVKCDGATFKSIQVFPSVFFLCVISFLHTKRMGTIINGLGRHFQVTKSRVLTRL